GPRLPGDAHPPGFGLERQVERRTVLPRPGLAVAGDRAEDEPRVERGERLVAEPQRVDLARAEVLDQDVARGRQPAEEVPALGRLHVEREAALVAVHAEVVGALPVLPGRTPGP